MQKRMAFEGVRPLNIGFEGPQNALAILSELLSPWNVSFTHSPHVETTIAYDTFPEADRYVVIPSNSIDFLTKAKKIKSTITTKKEQLVNIYVNPKIQLAITPTYSYHYDNCTNQEHNNDGIVNTLEASKVYLTIDVVNEFKRILDGVLNPKMSRMYKILTDLPIPYSIAPKKVKNLVMKQKKESLSDQTFCTELALDALRFLLVNAIEKSSNRRLSRRQWNKGKHAFVMTHDVESQEGLRRSKNFKKIEEKYDIPSAWYIPSKHYKLDNETVKSLSNYGEIGCHDTKHDGKLAFITKSKLNTRLREAKTALEELIRQPIKGVRTPLLQHNASILEAIRDNEFMYDTSIPTWEAKHPFTMKPHGIQTVFPLMINGLFEIPITMPQDHQMFAVSGYDDQETLEKWIYMANIVRDLGGLCLFLVHPDYQLSNLKTGIYEEILNFISSDTEGWSALPSQLIQED